jgi:hypothetical protein
MKHLLFNLNMDFGEVYRENQNFFNLGNKGFRPQEPKISTSTYLLNSSTYFSLPPEVKEVCNRAVTYQLQGRNQKVRQLPDLNFQIH